MGAFGKWLAVAVLVFGLTAAGYHAYLTAAPKRVLVVVDASYPMGSDWDLVPARLRDLAGARYTVYALATDKGPVHGWQPAPALGAIRPYGPRALDDLRQRLPAAWQAEATAVWLLTNAGAGEVPAGLDLKVLRVGH